ncbi:MAG: hypothetical protein WCS37_05275 [Chloroflexota bacterium]|nr:hypothetical protein [Chloroflexota bacterium]
MGINKGRSPQIYANLPRLYLILQIVGGVLLIAGFAGPWIYGPLGKSSDFGWQPVWGLLLHFLPSNLFVVAAIMSCFNYLELIYRRGQPVLIGLLKWIGGFFLLLVLPLSWFILDQTERGTMALHTDGTLGWGVWVTLLGLIIQVAALRIRIYYELQRKTHFL